MRPLLLFLFALTCFPAFAQEGKLFLRAKSGRKVMHLHPGWDYTLYTRGGDTLHGDLFSCTDSTLTLRDRYFTGEMSWDPKKQSLRGVYRDTFLAIPLREMKALRIFKLKDGAEGILFVAPIGAAALIGGAVTMIMQEEGLIPGAVLTGLGAFVIGKCWLYLHRSKGKTYALSDWEITGAKSKRAARKK